MCDRDLFPSCEVSEKRAEQAPQQAAAICYRHDVSGLQFLLVRTMDDRWTFPEGNIEPGQTEIEAAEMEAYEEAGVFGIVDEKPLVTYRYAKAPRGAPRSKEISVVAFLLRVRQSFPPRETYRMPEWFSSERTLQALAENRHSEDAQELTRVIHLAVHKLQA